MSSFNECIFFSKHFEGNRELHVFLPCVKYSHVVHQDKLKPVSVEETICYEGHGSNSYCFIISHKQKITED